MAQYRPGKLPKTLQNRYVLEAPAIDNPSQVMQSVNPLVNTKAVQDDVIGTSGAYDMQSNGSAMERVISWPDGTISAAWMKADLTSYADRGSGYNYFNGTTWGPAPTARIETIKTGWPNLCMWKGNGEIVVAHNSLSTLVMSTRPAKGTGAWTQTMGPTGPMGSAGVPLNLLWPRVITNGTNHQNVHVICLTMPVANGGITYKGIDGALIYYRSLDGGATWDKQAIQIADLDSVHYNSFSGDDYSWIEPHGDTIAFLQGSTWNGTFLMKSFDNGNTWTKQNILTNYYSKKLDTDTITPFYGCDGTMSGAMDKNGVFHVAIGRMFAAQHEDPTSGWGSFWNAGTDGVVYWNSTEAPLDTAMMANLDSIYAHDKLVGYVVNADQIVDFPYYKGSLSTYPQVNIDQYNNVYVMFTSVTVGEVSGDNYNYRHIWGRAKFQGHATWSEMVDFNTDPLYLLTEFAYPEVAKNIKNGKLQLLTQTSSQPGSNVAAGTTYPAVPVHEVSFSFREIPCADFIPVGIQPTTAAKRNFVSQNFPNPVKGTTSFTINVEKAANVVVEVSNIMGAKVMTMDKGVVNAGAQKFSIDCNSLTSGIYFYTVKINGESFTHKMIVE
jgi:hypothetical protein